MGGIRLAAGLSILISLTFSAAAFANDFACALYAAGQSYLELTDTASKKFDIYFATPDQCKSESARLHEAESDAARLPMEVCGCERWVYPTAAVGLTRKVAYLYCYDFAKDGSVSKHEVAEFTALWSDPLYACEQARQNSPNIEPVPPHKR